MLEKLLDSRILVKLNDISKMMVFMLWYRTDIAVFGGNNED